MNYGFIKVASAVPTVQVADCRQNVLEMESLIAQAEGKGAEIIVFPELCITGYTCQDLFRQQLLLDATEHGMMHLLDFTRKLDIISIVGLPIAVGNGLLNCAAVIQKGSILGVVPKTYLPNGGGSYEKRWFVSSQELQPTTLRFAGCTVRLSSDPQLFRTCNGVAFGVELGEDVWSPTPPSTDLALAGADLIFNLSATNEILGRYACLKTRIAEHSARTITGYVYSGAGYGESTQDVVYGGHALIYENGILLAQGERFSLADQMQFAQIDVERLRSERRNNTMFLDARRVIEGAEIKVTDAESIQPRDFVLERSVDPMPFIPGKDDMQESCDEIFNIQVMGLARRLEHTHAKTAIVGVSGGLDSTMALLVCVKTFDKLGRDRKDILGVTMPGFGTTDRTYANALSLMESLGVTTREIKIGKSVLQHFEDIGHDADDHDVTYENAQARERTQILMDLANELNGMVIGTGDLSELALGWATYNGDHMSMYGVNASVPKTLMQHLVRVVARNMDEPTSKTLLDIVDTPISPELTPADEHGNINQKTEDLVGPYELHDFFLYYFLRYGFGPRKIFLLAQRAFGGIPTDEEKGRHYDDETILHWLQIFCRRFFSQQFKRSCLPDGPKTGVVGLSSRGDWRMPSDAVAALWLREVESLGKRDAAQNQ
ncbi:MAG: NAD(+) synthase [Prevotella sp.]|jgi:NAD+ synthase (glutamine-hydrolysing)